MDTLNLNELKKKALKEALVKTSGCVSYTAKLLGITRATVYNLAKEHDVQIDSIRSSVMCGDSATSL